ncbi:hypothetical protein D3C76_1624530 [compost metagenome]
MLFGYQPDRRRIASAAFELFAIAQLGSQGAGGDRADTRHGHQTSRQIIFSCLAFHLLVQRFDLPIQIVEVLMQPHQNFFDGAGK